MIKRLSIKNIIDGEKRNGTFYAKIFQMTWPAFIELFLSSLFGSVDLIMVGRLGAEAIAGVGVTNQPFFLLVAIFSAVNVGATTLVSWSVGEGNKKKGSEIARQTILINVTAGVALSVLGAVLAGPVMQVMGNDPVVIAYSTSYLRIVCYGLAFAAVNMGVTAVLRGCGLTRIPMFYNLAANAVNVLFNYLLIYGKWGLPQMGVNGAAWATTISRVLGCVAAVCVLIFYKHSPVRINLRDRFTPNFGIIRDIFSIGLPAAGEQFVIQSGLVVFSRIVVDLGTLAYAAHQVAANINGLVFSVSQAFSVATTTLAGQSVGAGDFDRAEKYTILARRIARLVTFIIAITLVFFGRYIAAIYAPDQPLVIDMCVPLFAFMAVIHFIQSSQMSTAGALRGAGDTMYPLYASIAGIWTFRISLALLFTKVFKFGLNGAWLAFLIDQCLRAFIIWARFRSGKWRQMKAIRDAKKLKTQNRLKDRE